MTATRGKSTDAVVVVVWIVTVVVPGADVGDVAVGIALDMVGRSPGEPESARQVSVLPDTQHSIPILRVKWRSSLKTQQHWPTWVVVVAIIILIPPLVWALSTTMNILAALSIGGIVAVALIVALFVWLKNRVQA